MFVIDLLVVFAVTVDGLGRIARCFFKFIIWLFGFNIVELNESLNNKFCVFKSIISVLRLDDVEFEVAGFNNNWVALDFIVGGLRWTEVDVGVVTTVGAWINEVEPEELACCDNNCTWWIWELFVDEGAVITGINWPFDKINACCKFCDCIGCIADSGNILLVTVGVEEVVDEAVVIVFVVVVEGVTETVFIGDEVVTSELLIVVLFKNKFKSFSNWIVFALSAIKLFTLVADMLKFLPSFNELLLIVEHVVDGAIVFVVFDDTVFVVVFVAEVIIGGI